MNEGVKVLIERMKTNPEDFELVQDKNYKHGLKEGRFYWVSEQVRDYLSLGNQHMHLTLLMKEDLDALVDAFKEKHQQEFTDRVMRDLFREEQKEPVIKSQWLSGVSPLQGVTNTVGTWTDPRIAYLSQQSQAQIDSTSGLTSVSLGGTGTTATTGLLGTLTGIFK
jgi:hypothetical protein